MPEINSYQLATAITQKYSYHSPAHIIVN